MEDSFFSLCVSQDLSTLTLNYTDLEQNVPNSSHQQRCQKCSKNLSWYSMPMRLITEFPSHSVSQIPQLNASSISVEKGAQFLRVSVTVDRGST